jgi:hypothetical protein
MSKNNTLTKEEIIHEETNPFLSLRSLLQDGVPITTLVDQIEKNGVYTWDEFDRFKKASEQEGLIAIRILSHQYEWSSRTGAGVYRQSPLSEAYGEHDSYSNFGWTKKVWNRISDSSKIEHKEERPGAIGTPEFRSEMARHAAEARHSQPGGSRDKREQVREEWASGQYNSRDDCAEKVHEKIGLSFSVARDALKNEPNHSNKKST